MTARSATDVTLARLASRQKGVFALWQLEADDVLRKAIRLRVRTARLSELHPGVFAYGPTAVISHRTAAARTLCDLATLTASATARRRSDRQLRRAVQQADRCGRLDIGALEVAIGTARLPDPRVNCRVAGL